jgi:pilus assembly protein CpaB
MNSNGRALLFLALGVFSACIAVLLARQWMQGERNLPAVTTAPVVETVPVVVTLQDVPAGVALQTSQLSVVEWPKAYLPEGHFSAPGDLDQRVLRRSLRKKEVVLDSALLPVGSEAGLGSLILPGYRAISVKVDQVVAVAGFIKAGSRVDVLATQDREQQGVAYTTVILQDLKVLAIGQELERSDSGEAKPEVTVVTLECDPSQAQKLAYGAALGRLQLALRNPTDQEVVPVRSTKGVDLLALPAPPPPPVLRPPKTKNEIETIRGSEIKREAY